MIKYKTVICVVTLLVLGSWYMWLALLGRNMRERVIHY